MKPINTSFNHSGYTLTQVYRDGHLAIFQATKPNHIQPHHWEVVRIQILPAFSGSIKGVPYDYPDREAYPKSEDWGTHGFTADTLEDAHKRVRTMSQD